MDVRGPFVFCHVGVAGAYVAHLERFEVLEGAEFVGLGKGGFSVGTREERGGGRVGTMAIYR